MKKPSLLPLPPFRLWMTGSLAVVMAAMIPLRDVNASERNLRVARHSRYGVTETVQRIESAARGRGLGVLARVGGEQAVLVLASSVGGTPVLMQHADSRPSMPLSVLVRESRGGGADVFLIGRSEGPDDAEAPIAAAASRWDEWPAAVTDDLLALPSLVDQALA